MPKSPMPTNRCLILLCVGYNPASSYASNKTMPTFPGLCLHLAEIGTASKPTTCLGNPHMILSWLINADGPQPTMPYAATDNPAFRNSTETVSSLAQSTQAPLSYSAHPQQPRTQAAAAGYGGYPVGNYVIKAHATSGSPCLPYFHDVMNTNMFAEAAEHIKG